MSNPDQIVHLDIDRLQRGEYQPRDDFDEVALEELAQSIAKQGIVQPLIVRLIGKNKYEIVAGERRWRAAQLAGQNTVPCIIKPYTDEEAAEVSLIENIQREDLNPLEEAYAYQRFIKAFKYTHSELAKILGKSRTEITKRLSLLSLDSRLQDFLKKKVIQEGHARVLAGLDRDQQYPVGKECVDKGWSVRQLEKVVAKLTKGATDKKERNDDAYYRQFERHLGDQLGTEVTIERGEETKGGFIKIKYFDADTFSGLLERMGVKSDST
jgi:ParB family transcriptional regulator, chromosome partitioning protein